MFYIPDISKVYNSTTHKKHREIETHNNSTYKYKLYTYNLDSSGKAND